MANVPDDRDNHPDSTSQQSERQPGGFLHLAVQATTLGWNLVIPIVGGVLLGRYLDDLLDKEFTWTLALLVLGVIVAFNNLYTIYVEHGRVEPSQEGGKQRRQQELEEDERHAEDK